MRVTDARSMASRIDGIAYSFEQQVKHLKGEPTEPWFEPMTPEYMQSQVEALRFCSTVLRAGGYKEVKG